MSEPAIDLCLSSWSLHSEFLNGGITAAEFPEIARREFGVRQIEFFEGDFSPDFLDDGRIHTTATRVAKACEESHVQIAAIAAVNDLTEIKDAATHRSRIRRWLELAPVLGFRFLRLNSGRRKLTRDRLPQFIGHARELAKLAAKFNVTLVLENHPHLLMNREDVELFLDVFRQVDHPSFGACPDVGAFGPSFWREGMQLLAPYARHVHIKSWVWDRDDDGSLRQAPISEYLPVVRDYLLRQGNRYQGCFSYEHTEFWTVEKSHRVLARGELENAAKVLRSFLDISRPAPNDASKSKWDSVNAEPELSPPLSLLELLADGCQSRLKTQIRIHDFGTPTDAYSSEACHRKACLQRSDGNRRDENTIVASEFCRLVDEIPDLRDRCQDFHTKQLVQIEQGDWADARIGPCPMGLSVLTVPIHASKRLFGAITCGPWIEEGTEGMMTSSLVLADSTKRAELDQAWQEKTHALNISDLQASRKILGTLAEDLGQVYAERLAAYRNLGSGSKLINKLREEVQHIGNDPGLEDMTAEQVAVSLQPRLEQFATLIGSGGFLMVQLVPPEGQRDAHLVQVLLAGMSDEIFPAEFPLPPSVENLSDSEARRIVREHLRSIGWECISPALPESRMFVFYVHRSHPVGRLEDQLTRNDQILIQQLLAEVEYSVNHLFSLAQVRSNESGLRVFISRLKHAIAGCLTSVDHDIRALNNLMERPESPTNTVPKQPLRNLHASLRKSSNKAGAILKRLVGQVRLLGPGHLRPPLNFAQADIGQIAKSAVRQRTGSARDRDITVRLNEPDSLSELLWCDAATIEEVLDNLLDNAVKYATSSSIVRVSVYRSVEIDDKMSEHPWTLAQPGWRIVVENVGAGQIPPDDMSRLFEPFYQGKNVPPGDKTNRGTGIGLAICQQIVRSHHGRIFLVTDTQPVVYSGSRRHIVRFCVDLPFESPKTSSPDLGD